MRHERTALAAVTAVAVLVGGARVDAFPTAQLVYSRARGAESCPDEHALRLAVAERVGYDPFFASANKTVIAGMAPAPLRGFVATVSLVDEQGVDHGKRTFRTEGDCQELVDVAALAIAIAIDPQSLAPHVAKAPAPPPEAPPSAPTAVSILPPAPEADLEPARPVASSSPLAFDASAGVVVSGGLAPAPAVGGALGALIRWHRTSLGLEGRIDAPAARTAQGGGSLSSQLTVGTMLVCLHAGRLFGCALGQAGAANDQSEGVLAARSQSTLWLGAGARVGVDVPLQRTLALRVHTDFVGDLNARRLRLNDRDAWVAPVAAVSLGADALVHF